MKITVIEREVSQIINVDKYENIRPTVRMRAELGDGDSVEESVTALDAALTAEWNRCALSELRLLNKRRNSPKSENGVISDIMNHIKGEMLPNG